MKPFRNNIIIWAWWFRTVLNRSISRSLVMFNKFANAQVNRLLTSVFNRDCDEETIAYTY